LFTVEALGLYRLTCLSLYNDFVTEQAENKMDIVMMPSDFGENMCRKN